MCGKWILAHICYAFSFAPRTGCDRSHITLKLIHLWRGDLEVIRIANEAVDEDVDRLLNEAAEKVLKEDS
jgi:hypothetical protein